MAQEVTKSIKYGLVALSGLFGAAYLYYDFKKSEKELKQLEQDLEKVLGNSTTQKQDQHLIFEAKVAPATQQLTSQQKLARQVYCICITGGPGSGRISAITILKERLQEFQYNVLIEHFIDYYPLNQEREIAESLSMQEKHKLIIQQLILFQSLLDHTKQLASKSKKKDTIILCQGGLLDFLTQYDLSDQFYDDLAEQYEPLATIRDRNFDAVIHLVTNADGLLQNFDYGDTISNRQAEIDRAIRQDKAIQKIWTGHPHHFLIDNRGGNFDKKIQKTYKTVLKILGLEFTNIRLIKYQLDNVNFPKDYFTTKIKLTDVFLLNTNQNNECERVRIRQNEDRVKQYYHITKKKTDDNQIQIFRRFITAVEAQYLLRQSNIDIKILKRFRICFTYENQLMQVDQFEDQNLGILRIAQNDQNTVRKFPDWLKVNKRVDDNPKYDSFQLAKLHKK